jgi:multiple sugar transport system ATP-binding protein
MRSEIIKLHDQLGATFIYVTHDQVEAMTMGTRIVVMKDGFVQQIGAPQDLYDYPINTFVAGFIGTPQMNFFDGYITPDGKITFANNQTIKLSKEALANFDEEKIGSGLDIIMGIRPGDLKVLDAHNDMSVSAKVEVVEALGNETIIYANMDKDADGSIEKSPTSIVASAKLKKNPARKSEIILGIDEEAIHIFEKETERSIRK